MKNDMDQKRKMKMEMRMRMKKQGRNGRVRVLSVRGQRKGRIHHLASHVPNFALKFKSESEE